MTMRAAQLMVTLGCASALPHSSMNEAKVADMLDKGQFKGAKGADEVPAIHMANMSMLQLAEHSRGQLDPSTMRFERIEGALDAVENKIDRLLGNGYEHGHLIMETKTRSYAVRAMAPRGREKLEHALLLERRFLDDLWDDIVDFFADAFEWTTTALSTVTTVIVEVVVEVVTFVVDVVIVAVEALADALVSLIKFIGELLMQLAVAILREIIGADCVDGTVAAVEPLVQALNEAGEGTISTLVTWAGDWVKDKLDGLADDLELERGTEPPKPYKTAIKDLEQRMKKWDSAKKRCIKNYKAKDDLYAALMETLKKCRDAANQHKSVDATEESKAAYSKATSRCYANFRPLHSEYMLHFESKTWLAKECKELGPKPTLSGADIMKVAGAVPPKARGGALTRGVAQKWLEEDTSGNNLERRRGFMSALKAVADHVCADNQDPEACDGTFVDAVDTLVEVVVEDWNEFVDRANAVYDELAESFSGCNLAEQIQERTGPMGSDWIDEWCRTAVADLNRAVKEIGGADLPELTYETFCENEALQTFKTSMFATQFEVPYDRYMELKAECGNEPGFADYQETEVEVESPVNMRPLLLPLKEAAKQAGASVEAACDLGSSSDLERETMTLEQMAREMDVMPSFERRETNNCGGTCGCSNDEKNDAGEDCTSCPCTPVICISVAVEASASLQKGIFEGSGGVGAEIGGCIGIISDEMTGFIALGGGGSFGFEALEREERKAYSASAGLSATVAYTYLRDIGDVAGHGLTLGFTLGNFGFAAVFGIGSNANAMAELEEEHGGDVSEIVRDLYGTSFVGFTAGVQVAEVTFDTVPSPSGDSLGVSVDVGWAFGWDIPQLVEA